MKVRFVIEDVVGLGFYDSNTDSFRGYLFATKYETYEEAEKRIIKLEKGVYTIDKIYINE